MSSTEQSIEVDVAVHTAYNQWTLFEEFPRFMERIEEVRQLNDTRLLWRATIAGESKEWSVEIVERRPDRLISWRSTDGAPSGGAVRFEPIEPRRTRIYLRMEYDPEGVFEWLGDSVGVVERSVRDDLERFKQLIERREHTTGGWRDKGYGGALRQQSTVARAVGGYSPLGDPPPAEEELTIDGLRGVRGTDVTPETAPGSPGRSDPPRTRD